MIKKVENYSRNGSKIILLIEGKEFLTNSYALVKHTFAGWQDFDQHLKSLQNGFVAAIDEIKVLGFGAKKAVIAAYGTEEEKTAYAAQIAAREAAQKAQEEAAQKAQEEAAQRAQEEAAQRAEAARRAEEEIRATINNAKKCIINICFEDYTVTCKENLPKFSLQVTNSRFQEIRSEEIGDFVQDQETDNVIFKIDYTVWSYWDEGPTSWEEALEESSFTAEERAAMVMTNADEYEARKAAQEAEQAAQEAARKAEEEKEFEAARKADEYAAKIDVEIQKAYLNFSGSNKEFYHNFLKKKYDCCTVNYDKFSVLIFIGGPEFTRWFDIRPSAPVEKTVSNDQYVDPLESRFCNNTFYDLVKSEGSAEDAKNYLVYYTKIGKKGGRRICGFTNATIEDINKTAEEKGWSNLEIKEGLDEYVKNIKNSNNSLLNSLEDQDMVYQGEGFGISYDQGLSWDVLVSFKKGDHGYTKANLPENWKKSL